MKTFFITLAFTLLLGSGIAFFLFKERELEEGGEIQKLALISASSEVLKGEIVAEWLGLSIEKPASLSSFNLKEGAEKLLKNGVIDKVQLYKLPPSALVVSYTLKEPYARVLNWRNISVDREGSVFPFAPFFTPKELPEIVFPQKERLDFSPLEGVILEEFAYAKKIIEKKDFFSPWDLSRVDLSRMDPDHPYGGEIILTLKEGEKKLYLRFFEDSFEDRLLDFPRVSSKLADVKTADFRIPSKVITF